MLISIIIPARDAGQDLDRCLQRLSQSLFQDFECIVVDDHSADTTSSIAASWRAIVLRNDSCLGPARSRNRGALTARGSILFFLDADTLLHEGGLELLAARFLAEPALDAIFGSYDDTPAAPGIVSRFRNLLHCFTHQNGRREAVTFWTGCGAIRRKAFDSVGGFCGSYRGPEIEDVELGYRLSAAHRRVELDRRLLVTHLKCWNLFPMLFADVRYRGIPWVLLALRTRRLPNDLATRTSQKLSVVCTFALLCAAAALVCTGGIPELWLMAAASAVFFLANLPFFAFLYRTGGVNLALPGLPLQLLYNCCALLAIFCGCAYFCWRIIHPVKEPDAVLRASIEPFAAPAFIEKSTDIGALRQHE